MGTELQDKLSPETDKITQQEELSFKVKIDKPFAEENPWIYDFANREVRLKPSINDFTVNATSLTGFVTLTTAQTLTNKTLTAPVIADFTNMAHDHEDTDDGGQLDEDALALTDVVTNDAATTRHGFLKKLSNTATEFMNGVGNWVTPSNSSWTCGSTSKDAADASTTQTIAHGLGRTPVFVRLLAMATTSSSTTNPGHSEIVYNGTTNAGVSGIAAESGGAIWAVAAGFVLNLNFAGATSSHRQTGVVTFDATNITITWTKQESPTGTYTIIWMAT